MYRIVTVYPGDEIPDGRRDHPDRVQRLRTFLAQECLMQDGRYYRAPDKFARDHYNEYPEERAEETTVVLVWDPEPETNEFGRVSA